MVKVKVNISFEFDLDLDLHELSLEDAISEFKEELKEEFDDTQKLLVNVESI